MSRNISKIVYKASNGEKYEAFLFREETSVGRRDDNQLCLFDGLISKYHAIIRREEDGKFYIRDKNSANGIKINGNFIKPGKPFMLNDKDALEIGNFNLEFYEMPPPITKRKSLSDGENQPPSIIRRVSLNRSGESPAEHEYDKITWAIDMARLIKREQKEAKQLKREREKAEAEIKMTMMSIFLNRDEGPYNFNEFRKYLQITVIALLLTS